jgi:hypothetical protein
MSTPPPSQRVPVQGGGNGKYIAIAVVLLLGIGALVVWRITQKPPAPTNPTVAVTTSAPPPPPPKFDDVPPPPPVEDAGPDTGPAYHGPGIKPCEVTACAGSITADTEASLGMLAKQTRRKCYEPALAQDPSLMGHVDLKLKIAGDGEICTSSVDTADPGLQQVGECTARIIAAAGRVPAPRGCVNIKFPVTYKPLGK